MQLRAKILGKNSKHRHYPFSPMSEISTATFKALHADSITLHLINEENLVSVRSMLQGFPDSVYMLKELEKSYVPRFAEGVRTKYGFYALFEGELAGLS